MSVAPKLEPHPASVAPIFPIAMAAAWILQAFLGGGDPLPHLWRPLIVTTLAAAAVTGIVWVAARRRPVPLLVAGLFVLLVLKAWPLLGAVLAIVIWRGALSVMRRLSRRPPLAVPMVVHVFNRSTPAVRRRIPSAKCRRSSPSVGCSAGGSWAMSAEASAKASSSRPRKVVASALTGLPSEMHPPVTASGWLKLSTLAGDRDNSVSRVGAFGMLLRVLPWRSVPRIAVVAICLGWGSAVVISDLWLWPHQFDLTRAYLPAAERLISGHPLYLAVILIVPPPSATHSGSRPSWCRC